LSQLSRLSQEGGLETEKRKGGKMRLAGRIERLEQAHGGPSPELPKLDLAPELLRRIAAAQAAGTYPHALTDADLEAIVAAGDKERARHGKP
jgi:hypothetical protein